MTLISPQALLVLAALAAVALPAMAIAKGPEPFGTLTVEQVAADLRKPGVHLFDANTEEVYAAGHLPGAKLVSYQVKASDLPADRDATLIFYCKNPH